MWNSTRGLLRAAPFNPPSRGTPFRMITLEDEKPADGRMDAVILAGGRPPEDLARRSETQYKALIPFDGIPSIVHAFRAARASAHVGRVAVVGPGELGQISEIASCDLFLPESNSMEANLFTVFARLLPEDRILVLSCDAPQTTPEALDDFIGRSAPEAAVNVPVVRHELYLRKYPRAPAAPLSLKDGHWLPGNCAIIHSRSIPRLQRLLPDVFRRRGQLREIIALLGWQFAWKVKMKRVTLGEVEAQICDAAALPIRLVRDCDPVLAMDIDSLADWEYIRRWAAPAGARV